jgi:hypothetical protein
VVIVALSQEAIKRAGEQHGAISATFLVPKTSEFRPENQGYAVLSPMPASKVTTIEAEHRKSKRLNWRCKRDAASSRG